MEGRGKDVGFPVSPTIPAFWCGLALPLFWVDRLGFYFLIQNLKTSHSIDRLGFAFSNGDFYRFERK